MDNPKRPAASDEGVELPSALPPHHEERKVDEGQVGPAPAPTPSPTPTPGSTDPKPPPRKP
jgi:hypothetical protein